MKFCCYNHFVTHNGHGLMYNALTDSVIALTPDTERLLQRIGDDADALEEVHPSLYECLVRKGFLVESDCNEYDTLVGKLRKKSDESNVYQLTINPTMDCNYRCWYCYESHEAGSRMDGAVSSSVCKLIERILHDDEVSKLNLAFFGGEPLLYFEDIDLPLMEFARKTADDTGKKLDILFTTNGYLLDENVLASLKGFPISDIQIPFDGGRSEHDATKKNVYGTSSFDVTVSNTSKALESEIPVTVRCNYTRKTIDSFASLADAFSRYAGHPCLDVSFHKVWQQQPSEDLQEHFHAIYELFKGMGFRISDNEVHRGLCYADHKRSAVVNYNGDVYKCTARKFDGAARLGILRSDGQIEWNEKAKVFAECKYKSETCRSCRIFPICLQGCSQNVLDYGSREGCLMGYSKNEMAAKIERRVKLLVDGR